VVVIFAVITPIPYSIHWLRQHRWSPRSPRWVLWDFTYCIDHFTAFAFAALDSWFCLGWLLLLRLFRSRDRER